MNEAPPNKLFDAGYRQRYPRGTAAQEAYEQACDRGASKETLAALNTAYCAACTADEQEQRQPAGPPAQPPALKCACGDAGEPDPFSHRCRTCSRPRRVTVR